MLVLGEANSRMRDFFDIHALAQRERFQGDPLARALRATFERRRTAIPNTLPLALTPAFARIPEKQRQWQGFLRRSGVLTAPQELDIVVAGIAAFLAPAIAAARHERPFRSAWSPGGPWRPK